MGGEAEVDARARARILALGGQRVAVEDGREVRVLEHRGHATRRCGRGSVLPVLTLGGSGVHQVHVRVDEAGQHEQAFRVDGASARLAAGLGNRRDAPVADGDIGAPQTTVGDQIPALERQFH